MAGAALVATAASASCGPAPRGSIGVPRAACAIGAPGGPAARPRDSLVVASPSPVDGRHAPWPANAGERFVFAQVYQTLIDVDCAGSPVPALAQSWTRDASGTRVTLLLRPDAHFSSGEPLTSRSVIDAWRATAASADTALLPRERRELAQRLADAATTIDDRTLTVSLPDTSWRVLAAPALAVYRPPAEGAPPAGTGPYRVAASERGAITLVAMDGGRPPIVLRWSSDRDARDARDAIDAGAAVVLGATPTVESYARSRGGLMAAVLPWDRTYVLVAPSGVPAVLAVAEPDSVAALGASLARDVVRAGARPAQPPYWWIGRSECGFMDANDSRPAPAPVPGVGYRGDDSIARGLAERLVGLRPGLTAVPLDAADFARALRAGRGVGFVLPLPRTPLSPCADVARLFDAAPWLAAGSVESALVPLVDTRPHALIDSTRISARVDWDGTLHVVSGSGRP